MERPPLAVANRQEDGSFLLLQSSDGSKRPEDRELQLVLKISMSKPEDAPSPP